MGCSKIQQPVEWSAFCESQEFLNRCPPDPVLQIPSPGETGRLSVLSSGGSLRALSLKGLEFFIPFITGLAPFLIYMKANERSKNQQQSES